jgi:hypothetical protein
MEMSDISKAIETIESMMRYKEIGTVENDKV